MDWLQAQSAARGGKKVKRGSWPDTRVVVDSQGTLQVTDVRGFGSNYAPTEDDRKATDWRVVEDAAHAEAIEKASTERAASDETASVALRTDNAQQQASEPKAARKPAVEGSKR
jgi:hypothetical protein